MADITDEFNRAVVPIREELETRLEFTFSDKDEVALVTALLKAAQAGLRTGVRACELEARRLGLSMPLFIDVHMRDRDLWQELYGEAE